MAPLPSFEVVVRYKREEGPRLVFDTETIGGDGFVVKTLLIQPGETLVMNEIVFNDMGHRLVDRRFGKASVGTNPWSLMLPESQSFYHIPYTTFLLNIQ